MAQLQPTFLPGLLPPVRHGGENSTSPCSSMGRPSASLPTYKTSTLVLPATLAVPSILSRPRAAVFLSGLVLTFFPFTTERPPPPCTPSCRRSRAPAAKQKRPRASPRPPHHLHRGNRAGNAHTQRPPRLHPLRSSRSGEKSGDLRRPPEPRAPPSDSPHRGAPSALLPASPFALVHQIRAQSELSSATRNGCPGLTSASTSSKGHSPASYQQVDAAQWFHPCYPSVRSLVRNPAAAYNPPPFDLSFRCLADSRAPPVSLWWRLRSIGPSSSAATSTARARMSAAVARSSSVLAACLRQRAKSASRSHRQPLRLALCAVRKTFPFFSVSSKFQKTV